MNKTTLRQEFRERRNAVPPEEALRAGEALARHWPGEPRISKSAMIGLYYPVRGELDSVPLLEKLFLEGWQTALPVINPGTQVLSFHTWKPGELLVNGVFNVPCPPHTAKMVMPDVLVVPLLAFDNKGHRLGYGGGYYDTTLQYLRGKKDLIAIGAAYECQRTESELPAEIYDERIDAMITEKGFTWLS